MVRYLPFYAAGGDWGSMPRRAFEKECLAPHIPEQGEGQGSTYQLVLTGLSASEGDIIASEGGHNCFGGRHHYLREQYNLF